MFDDTSKQAMRFWTALISLAGLISLTLLCVLLDQFCSQQISQLTMLFAGGLISTTAMCAQWLFRNGSDAGKEPAG